MSRKVFFSYNSSDSSLVEIYLDLLVRAGLVARDETFCFERPGAQGTTGRVISDEVRAGMSAPVAVALVSESYVASQYCVGEFGFLRFNSAETDSTLIPVLIPPLTAKDAGDFFADIGLLEGFSSLQALNSLHDLVARKLVRSGGYSVWEVVREEASAALQRAIDNRPLRPRTEMSLDELPEESLGKILAVRRERLTERERAVFYERFQSLQPKYHVPVATVAPAELQLQCEAARPIDDRILLDLCDAFDIPPPPLARPLTDESKEAIQSTARLLSASVYASVRAGEIAAQPAGSRAIAWRRAYNYLSCQEILGDLDGISETDVILVPGARKGHVFRADEAASVARRSINPSLVLFSGGHPIFDDEQDLPFGEADALAERFLGQYAAPPDTLKLRSDNRARTTAETVTHMRVHLQPLVADLKRPAKLTLVTSPYHMRRLYYLVAEAVARMPHLVGAIRGSLSLASFDWGVIAHPRSGEQQQLAEYGIGLYAIELAKLYGGRATAEF